MRCFLLSCFLLALQHFCRGQEALVHDSARITVRTFREAMIRQYKEDTDFQYENIVEPPASLWSRFWTWFWVKINELFIADGVGRVINIILLILAVGTLLFFILKLTGMTRDGLFGKANRGEKLGFTLLDEDIHGIAFDEAIRDAVEQKNYRFAVRLMYLQSLKFLSDRQLISWQVNKTNITYLQELASTPLHQPFRFLTIQFENNWYGDLPIGEDEFDLVREQFNYFNAQLSRS